MAGAQMGGGGHDIFEQMMGGGLGGMGPGVSFSFTKKCRGYK